MITMIDKQSIILGFHRHGKSRKQLARELGISRKTVKKYLKAHQAEMNQAIQSPDQLPVRGIIQPPRYDTSSRSRHKLTQQMEETIIDFLRLNKQRKSQGQHKQMLKKTDIHQALKKAGHQISYRSVCRYISQQEMKSREVFIRQQYAPGEATQFDWGEVKLCINGINKRFMLAVFTSCYSNHRWARLYHRQDTSSFLDSHAQYFDYTGGVQREVVYDNMKTAVRKFAIKNKDKTPTDALLKMSCYYQFNYRFCNARRGNEKGHIERSVEYVRRKAFAALANFDSVSDANAHLLQICGELNQKPLTGKTISIQANFAEELRYMKVAPSAFDAAELKQLRVDKYSCIKVDTNWYSVMEGHVGEMLEVKIYPSKVLVYSTDNQLIASHKRRDTVYEFYLNIDHYLKTLHQKPGALTGALSLKQADQKLRNIFETYYSNRPKLFITTLLFVREKGYNIPQLQAAIERCLDVCPHQEVSVDKIKIFLQMNPEQVEPSPPPTDTQSCQIARYAAQQLKTQQSFF